MNLLYGVEKLQQDVLYARRRQNGLFRTDEDRQILPVDQIKDHVGGLVFLEGAVNSDDVRMTQLGETAGFAHEHLYDRPHLRGMSRAVGNDRRAVSMAEIRRKALLDDDFPTKDIVRGPVRHTEPPGPELSGDRELPTRKNCADRKRLLRQIVPVSAAFARHRNSCLKSKVSNPVPHGDEMRPF